MKTFKKDFQRVEGRIPPLTLDYIRKFLNQGCKDIYLLRYGLIHRLGAVHHHAELLNDYMGKVSHLANSSYDEYIHREMQLNFRLSYFFDDLIFNMMSFYDYMAGFLCYIAYDKEIREMAEGYDPLNNEEHKYEHLSNALYNMSWTSVARLSKEEPEQKQLLGITENKFHKTKLAEIVNEHDNKFVEQLSRFRNRIIHNQVASPIISVTLVGSGPNEIDFRTPKNLIDRFPTYPQELDKATEVMLNSFVDGVEQIILAMRDYIENNRRIPKGEEIYKYKSELEEDDNSN
jgi:hypothetical protein